MAIAMYALSPFFHMLCPVSTSFLALQVKIKRITAGKPNASTVAMQYKAHDSGVDLFAVGTAAGHV
jgi:hypothetical protein